MSKSNDPLAALFINDAKATDRKQLADLVLPFLSIDQDSKEFTFLMAFSKIDGNMSKIEILLAGAKARSAYLNEPDGLQPLEIIATGIMAIGSVKSSLKKLYDEHKIKKDRENRYYIPSYRILDLIKQYTINNKK